MNPIVRAALERLFNEWDAFIGTEEADGHDDATLVGDRIGELRQLMPTARPSELSPEIEAALMRHVFNRGSKR